jgi:hypothetical protein
MAMALPGFAADFTPVARVDALGGQVFFNDYLGRLNSKSERGDWLLGDGIKLSSAESVIPTLNGQYTNMAEVLPFGGGGTLVTQTLDNTAMLRWVQRAGAWAVKPFASFKNEMLTISDSESLDTGLFDSDQGGAGVELEWKGRRHVKSVRQDLSWDRTAFYHYNPSSPVNPLFGQELFQNVDALNFDSYSYELSVDEAPNAPTLLSASLGMSYLYYPDQQVFSDSPVPTGELPSQPTSQKRVDYMDTATVGATRRWSGSWGSRPWAGSAGLTAGYVGLSSNQNNFDDGQSQSNLLRVNPNYYSYDEFSAGPLLNVTLGGGWLANLSYNYAFRAYRSRPVQNADGAYPMNAAEINTRTQTLSYSLTCPLTKRWSFQASGGYVDAASNTQFDKFYLYSYGYLYYFAGFGVAL